MFFNVPPVTRFIIVANALMFLAEMARRRDRDAARALAIGPQFAPGRSSRMRSCTGASRTSPSTCWRYTCSARISSASGGRAVTDVLRRQRALAAAAQLAFPHSRVPTIRRSALGRRVRTAARFALYFPTAPSCFCSSDTDAGVAVRRLYGAAELVFGVTGTQAGIAHFAHLGGMLGGYLLIRSWRSHGGPWLRRWK